MKITCQSCQSKYNVADEKVQGKVVKIRCRKCGATIVVDGSAAPTANGTSSPPAATTAPATTSAAASGSEGADANPWHVNVAENDQRTMTLAELVEAYNGSVVTQDTFIWTEGMEDWKALGEVEVVVQALHDSAQQAGGAPEPAAGNGYVHEAAGLPRLTTEEATDASTRVYEPAAAASAFSSFEPAAEAPAPAAAVPAAPGSSPRAEPKRAAVVRRENRARDLFASRAEEGPSALDVQTSAPSLSHPPPAMDDKRTGERNENSVLFSLAVLTQNADQRAPVAESGSADDSGLIDLKALAAKTESMRPSAGVADAAVFSAPFGGGQQLAAPVGAFDAPLGSGETQGKSRTPLYVVLGIAGVLLVGGGGMILGARVLGGGTAPMPSASALAMPSASAEPEPSATTSATASAAASASAAPSASVAARPRPAAGPVAPRPAAAARPAAANAGGGDTPPPAAAPPPPAKKSDCGCNGDLMCLMKCSTH